MRITNSMINNTMLLNMNRNMKAMSVYYEQMASQKKIQVPSDDPILAARAIKFRTSVAKTEQYSRNVDQGLSWMTAAESALGDVDTALLKIYNLIETAANGTNTAEDRAAIATQIQEIMESLGHDMLADYTGRYVFSGFRTDQPPVYTADNQKSYNISQYFSGSDVQDTQSFQRIADEVEIKNVKILKTAYDGSEDVKVMIGGVAYTVRPKSILDADAYEPVDVPGATPVGTIHYIKETGELVLSADAYNAVKENPLTVNYNKTGFKAGELNPIVYFDCIDFYGAVQTDAGIRVPSGSQSFVETDISSGAIPITPVGSALDNVKVVVKITGGGSTTYDAIVGPPVSPSSGKVYYNGGSIIFDADLVTAMGVSGASINVTYGEVVLFSPVPTDTYTITQGFGKGDIVAGNKTPPMAYFPIKPVVAPVTSSLNVAITNSAGVLTTYIAKPMSSTAIPTTGSGEVYYDPATGIVAFDPDIVNRMGADDRVSVTYDKTGLTSANTNPAAKYATVLTTAAGVVTQLSQAYDMKDQNIAYEFSMNTRVNINTLAKDVYTDKLYADLKELCRFVKSIVPSERAKVEDMLRAQALPQVYTSEELKEKTDKYLADEDKDIQVALHDRLSDMMGLLTKHQTKAMTQHTDLGSRMNRLELIQTRLEDDYLNYKKLLSDSEDVNLGEVSIMFSMTKAAYEGSLKVAASILQLSLVDFI